MNKIFIFLRKTFLRSFLGGVRAFYVRYFYNQRKHMGACDPTAVVSRPITIKNPQNVFLYEHTKLVDCVIMATNAKFIMKRYSSAAEGFKAITGTHERRIGRFFRSIKEFEKAKGLDKDIVISEDVWIGVNVTIIAGVNVGRGATIAAGAVVTKNIAPYSLNGGIPCKFLKFYWTIDEIIEHESKLYEEHERFSREELQNIFDQYTKK